MKTLKFAPPENPQQSFADAVRKNVHLYFKENNLSTKGNGFVVLQTIAMLAMYMVPFLLLLSIPMPMWIAVLLTVIMGIGTAGIGMSVMHSAAHGAYSERAWVNNLLASTMYALGGNVFNWKIQHNVLHHTYTNIGEYDPDIATKGPIRLSDHAPLRGIHRYQYIHAFFFYGLMTLYKIYRDFGQMAEYNKAGYARQFHKHASWVYFKMVLVKAIYLALIIGLPILVSSFSWWQVLMGFVIMHWTSGLILSTVFQLAHVVEGLEQPLPGPTGIVDNDWAIHELQTTANFARHNHLLNWYIGGLNFQIEHHLFPHICHNHYPKIAPIVEQTALEYGLTYTLKPTLRAALGSHVRRLKELGRPLALSA